MGGQQMISSLIKPKLTDLANPSGATGDILVWDGTNFVRLDRTEASFAGNAGANDTILGTTHRHFRFATMPTTARWYICTGLECKNGLTVAGNIMMGLQQVNAIPPTTNPVNTFAYTPVVAMAGASAVQRVNAISSHWIRGGTIVGAYLVVSDATATFATLTVSATNRSKAIVLNSAPTNGDSTAWVTQTEELYLKIYYEAVG